MMGLTTGSRTWHAALSGIVLTLTAALGDLQAQGTPGRDAPGQHADPLSVPRFQIAESPLALSGDVRGGAYLGAVGRRAAWLGTEDGDAELWVHPLELADRFGLAFRIPDYDEPVTGKSVARTVEIRPELMTITYSHATFTVREHILAPHDEPGLLVLLDVESIRPLEIQVQFRTLLQYAWPGALGGQYAFWDQDQRAFILSESLRRHNAVIGSPWAESGTTHAAHALPDAPSTFSIPIDLDRAGREFVPIAAYASVAPRDSVLAGYRRLIGNAHRLYEDKREHIESLLARSVSVDTPDDRLDRALSWSIVNLDEQLTCNPDLGCGLVAGWGASGESARPGFGWFFGGDAAINTLAMDLAGLWPQVADGLRFLARYQRDDGKIPHEISQAAAAIPWFTEFPYAYYHADTTPYWILAVWRYWRASGDEALLDELWPDVLEAYGWCLTAETDGDGIIENTVGGLGAVEVGAIGAEIHQDIYLAGVWIEALRGMSEMAAARGDRDLAADAGELLQKARQTLESRYWREDAGHYAFGILRSGETNDALTVWPATAGAFGLFEPERGRRNMLALAGDAISSDWGARMLASTHELFDPMGYNMGAVWPFVTGFVSWGQYRYRRPWSGFPLIDAVSRMTFDWARGRHPELLSGAFYRPLDTTVPHQFFATSMLVTPFLAGVLGWEPDAPGGRARLAPQLPAEWDRVAIQGLSVGPTRLDVTLIRSEGVLEAVVRREGPPVTLDLVLPAPAGAREVQFTHPAGDEGGDPEGAGEPSGSQAGTGGLRRDPSEVRVRVGIPLASGENRATLSWVGGLEVETPRVDLKPGQRSRGLRVLDFRSEDGGWTLVLEGSGGTSYEVRLRGEPVALATEDLAGIEFLGREGPLTRIRVMFDTESAAGPSRRSVRRVRLEPARGGL